LKQHRMVYVFLVVTILTGALVGCEPALATQTPSTQAVVTSEPSQGSPSQNTTSNVTDNPDWDEASHGNQVEPDYTVVFPQDSVNRIDITLSPEGWAALQTELTEQFGAQGQTTTGPGQLPGDRGGNGQPPGGVPQRPGNIQPGDRPANGGRPGMNFGDTSYVAGTVSFHSETWENVGFRYSGNSTLQNSWRNGTQKISFRLDFDEFEDQDSSVTNQRFYGFKQLSFKSNAMDSSYIREKVVADIFRESGVAASQTAFYEVYVDYGEGSQYFGLYTVVEIVDDTVIKTQFSDDSGNVYKPEGAGAAFVDGTFDPASFEKQTNQEEADWSDIQAVFSTLNSDLRTADPAAWRAGLEAVFDVDAFIRWLAVDTIVQNWDTYGSMAHNYYLYTDPADGLVTWIPWDNNEALSAGKGGGPGGKGPGGGVRELNLGDVGEQWPLIRFLMDDPVYLAKYQQYLGETIQGAFQPEKLAATYQKYHDLIAPYVQQETPGYTQLSSSDSFNQSVDKLSQHAQSRYDAVVAYLSVK
jgi:spore coat protein H